MQDIARNPCIPVKGEDRVVTEIRQGCVTDAVEIHSFETADFGGKQDIGIRKHTMMHANRWLVAMHHHGTLRVWEHGVTTAST
ncbi:MAG: hypothetical protein AW07_03287 [Candidatus Accumulibacter sp. SK-11]|nr:MAG: hypothetical protein AW07_03287 [Candidatus Accumulibacter sp. SK-11]